MEATIPSARTSSATLSSTSPPTIDKLPGNVLATVIACNAGLRPRQVLAMGPEARSLVEDALRARAQRVLFALGREPFRPVVGVPSPLGKELTKQRRNLGRRVRNKTLSGWKACAQVSGILDQAIKSLKERRAATVTAANGCIEGLEEISPTAANELVERFYRSGRRAAEPETNRWRPVGTRFRYWHLFPGTRGLARSASLRGFRLARAAVALGATCGRLTHLVQCIKGLRMRLTDHFTPQELGLPVDEIGSGLGEFKFVTWAIYDTEIPWIPLSAGDDE